MPFGVLLPRGSDYTSFADMKKKKLTQILLCTAFVSCIVFACKKQPIEINDNSIIWSENDGEASCFDNMFNPESGELGIDCGAQCGTCTNELPECDAINQFDDVQFIRNGSQQSVSSHGSYTSGGNTVFWIRSSNDSLLVILPNEIPVGYEFYTGEPTSGYGDGQIDSNEAELVYKSSSEPNTFHSSGQVYFYYTMDSENERIAHFQICDELFSPNGSLPTAYIISAKFQF